MMNYAGLIPSTVSVDVVRFLHLKEHSPKLTNWRIEYSSPQFWIISFNQCLHLNVLNSNLKSFPRFRKLSPLSFIYEGAQSIILQYFSWCSHPPYRYFFLEYFQMQISRFQEEEHHSYLWGFLSFCSAVQTPELSKCWSQQYLWI